MSLLKKIWRPLLALLFLFFLVKKGPFKIDQLKFVFSQTNILLLGLVFFALQFYLFSIRWKLFVDQISILKIKSAFRLTLIGQFFSFFIPGGVGGDVVKALELSQEHIMSKSAALSTVIADRVLGLFCMILMATLCLLTEALLGTQYPIARLLFFSSSLLAILTMGLLFSHYAIQKLKSAFNLQQNQLLIKFEKLINSFDLTFKSFRNSSLQVKNFFLSLMIQMISIYFMYTVVKTLNVEPPGFFIFFSLCCFGFLASAIPLTPAGIGVGQAAFYFLFSSFSPEVGAAAVTTVSVVQIFQIFYALIGGLLFSIKPLQKIEVNL